MGLADCDLLAAIVARARTHGIVEACSYFQPLLAAHYAAGASPVGTELQRIRSFFDRVREEPAAAKPEPGGRTSEPTESKDPNAFPAGTRVQSPRFGTGTVLAASGSGDGLTYTVRFDQSGDKRILARFGGLQRV